MSSQQQGSDGAHKAACGSQNWCASGKTHRKRPGFREQRVDTQQLELGVASKQGTAAWRAEATQPLDTKRGAQQRWITPTPSITVVATERQRLQRLGIGLVLQAGRVAAYNLSLACRIYNAMPCRFINRQCLACTRAAAAHQHRALLAQSSRPQGAAPCLHHNCPQALPLACTITTRKHCPLPAQRSRPPGPRAPPPLGPAAHQAHTLLCRRATGSTWRPCTVGSKADESQRGVERACSAVPLRER